MGIRIIVLSVLIWTFSSTALSSGICTGFLISPVGHIGTAAHCLSSNSGKYWTITAQGMFEAKLVAVDTAHDVGILKIPIKTKTYFKLRDGLPWGNHVVTIGFPVVDLLGYFPKTFAGVVIQYLPKTFEYVFTLYVAPGSSGSPVFDYEGNVVAVVTKGRHIDFVTGSMFAIGTDSKILIDLARKNLVPIKQGFNFYGEAFVSDLMGKVLQQTQITKIVLIVHEE